MKAPSRNFTLYPLAWCAAFFAAGILSSNSIPITFEWLLAASLIAAILAATLKGYNYSIILVGIVFFFLGMSALQIERQTAPDDRLRDLFDSGVIESGSPVEIEGVLLNQPEPSVDGSFFRVEVDSVVVDGQKRKTSGTVRLFATADSSEALAEYRDLDLGYGSRLRLQANLLREESFLNPGVISRKKLLDQQGIDAVGTVKSPLLIEDLGDVDVFLPLAWIYEQRVKLIEYFHRLFTTSTAGILSASLLGDKYLLDKATADVFRDGGTFHVLVISGLHITFIGGLVLLITRAFTKNRFWQFAASSIFLWGYTLAVGAEVPATRATVMFTVLALAHIVRRKASLLNGLGICALVLLAWRPEDLFTASFQLTFTSVIAIVAAGFPLIENLRRIGSWTPSEKYPFPARVPAWLRRACEMIYWQENVWEIERSRQIWTAGLFKSPIASWPAKLRLQKVLSFIVEGVIISTIVQLWMLPLLVVYFHRVSIGSIFLNLWVGFFIALESFLGLLAVGVEHISGVLAGPLVGMTEFVNRLQLLLPTWLASNDLASFRLPVYAGGWSVVYFLYYLPVIVLTFVVFHWRPFDHRPGSQARQRLNRILAKDAAVILALLVALIIFHPFSSPSPDGRLHVDFLDVGQGDSALITFPNGHTMLVDGGGKRRFDKVSGEDAGSSFEPDTPRIGEAVVSEFLWEKGFSGIDYVVATHADADHIQGVTDVVMNFGVRYAITGRHPAGDPDFDELMAALEHRRVPLQMISRGQEFGIDGVTVQVLNPDPNDSPDAQYENDQSVVLRLVYGRRKILLTADIESGVENKLVRSTNDLSADVAKVPHHGSRTSSTPEFIARSRPELAIISVGKRSMFGHPNAEVVDRWTNAGARVMTTGSSGTISVSTDGQDLLVSTFVK